jgi:hypothetical protein
MKTITISFLLSFALLCPYDSFAQPVDSTEEPEPPLMEAGKETGGWGNVEMGGQGEVEKKKSPMDGLTLLMGVLSPVHAEMKDMYGSAFTLSGRYCLSMGGSTDILTSIGFVQKTGDPYYDDLTFSPGESSTLRVIPLEISIRRRMVFMRSPSGLVSRGLYAGAGINYIRATEEIPGILSARGGDFGAQIFAGPQMFFTDNLAFEGEMKLLMSEVDMKYEDNRYSITLSGLVIRVGLSWYY